MTYTIEFNHVDSVVAGMLSRPSGKLVIQGVRVFWDGAEVRLTLGELRIVQMLASQPGEFFAYRAIYDVLRGPGFVAGEGERGFWANVRSAIKRIRTKFRDHDPNFDAIESFSDYGYCWRLGSVEG